MIAGVFVVQSTLSFHAPRIFALLVCSVFPALNLGCGDDAGSDAGGFDAADAAGDAGPASDGSRPDAGSRDDGGNTDDGGMADDGVDAGAPPGSVTVFVTDPRTGDPVQGAQIVFQNADGLFLSTTLTDETGSVSGSVGVGGMVTAIRNTNDEFTAQTWMGLQPPEVLRVKLFSRTVTIEQPLSKVPLRVASSPAFAELRATAGGVAQPFAGTEGVVPVFFSGVDAAGNFNILALGTSTVGAAPLAYATSIDLPQASTASVTLPNWRTDLAAVRFDWGVAPAAAAELKIQGRLLRGEAWYGVGQALITGLGGSASHSIFIPPGFGTGFAYETMINDGPRQRESSVAVSLAAVPAQVNVGLSEAHLAFVDNLSIIYDIRNRPVIEYEAPALALAAADLVGLRLDYRAQKGGKPHRWTLYRGPAGTPSLQFPELPAFTAASSAPYDSLLNGYRVTLSDYEGIEGYAALRLAPSIPPESARIRRTTMKLP